MVIHPESSIKGTAWVCSFQVRLESSLRFVGADQKARRAQGTFPWKSTHILSIYPQSEAGINPSPKGRRRFPPAHSLLFYLWPWVTPWWHHRSPLEAAGLVSNWAVIQHQDAQTTTKNQPQAVWCLSNPAYREEGFQLQSHWMWCTLWKARSSALRNHLKPAWCHLVLSFCHLGERAGGGFWMAVSEQL